nr:MAG TPA: hypothetical protein [Caudoviricetes sp.]
MNSIFFCANAACSQKWRKSLQLLRFRHFLFADVRHIPSSF